MTLTKIYVPKAVQKSVHIEVKRKLSYLFGGYSVYNVTGGWVDSDNELIQEDTLVYESYTDIIVTDVNKDMHELAKHVKEHSHEEAVLYVINHTSHIV